MQVLNFIVHSIHWQNLPQPADSRSPIPNRAQGCALTSASCGSDADGFAEHTLDSVQKKESVLL